MEIAARAHGMDKVIELIGSHPCGKDAKDFREQLGVVCEYDMSMPTEELRGAEGLLAYLRKKRHQPGTAGSVIAEIQRRIAIEFNVCPGDGDDCTCKECICGNCDGIECDCGCHNVCED